MTDILLNKISFENWHLVYGRVENFRVTMCGSGITIYILELKRLKC